jgi:hypothetical protein
MSTDLVFHGWPRSRPRLPSWVPLLIIGLLSPALLSGQTMTPRRASVQVGASVLRPAPSPTPALISALLERQVPRTGRDNGLGFAVMSAVLACGDTLPPACRVVVTLDLVRS